MAMADRSLSTTLDSSVWFDVTAEQLANGSADALFPFTPGVNESIRERRAALDGTLFFDELLILAGLSEAADAYFPPATPLDLANLLAEIDKCEEWEQLRRDCLCYYLLKFWCEEDGENRAARFKSSKLIPQGFAILADAYFHLDEGDSESAVRCLTDMRVRPDFVPKIMHALSVSASPPTVLRFVRLAKPPLTDQASIEIYVGALCASNIVDALLYVRNFPESNDETAQRARLTGMILNSCLMPQPRPDALNTLLSFPLTAYEQILLNTYALRPPPPLPESSLATLQDLIIVRLIHQGKYSDAITLDRLFVGEAASAGWTGSGSGAVAKASEGRRETFQEILAVLPDIQRRLLDVSLEEQHQARAPAPSQPTAASSNGAPLSADLTMSWEELGRSTYTLTSSATSTRASNIRLMPQTPLSASAALRTATNPRVAVLRAFTQATPSRPLSPANAGACFGAKLEGSPAPGARPSSYLAQSTASRFDASTSGGAPPLSPFDVTSPFVSRPRLTYTPMHQQIQPPKFGPSTRNTNRQHPLQQSRSSSFFLSMEGGSPSTTPAGSPAPAPSRNGDAGNRTYPSQNRGRAGTATSSRGNSSIPPAASWGTSLFEPTKSNVLAAAPDESTADPGRVFKPSHTLLRTPFLPSTARQGLYSSTTIPPLPEQPTRLFGQSTSTPSKKRGREKMQALWGGDENANDKIEFVVSSDDEQSPVRPQRVRPRLYGPDPGGITERRGNMTEVAGQLADANDTAMLDADTSVQAEPSHAVDDSPDAVGDEAAEAELRRIDSVSEFPGAFPEDAPADQVEQSSETSVQPRSRKWDSENRHVLTSWAGAAENEVGKRVNGRGSSSANTTAKSKSSAGKTTARKASSRRSTRASSVVSDAPTEETEPDQETAAPATRSSTLRRSSRLSTAPATSEAQEQFKTKKIRASSSPPRDGKRKTKGRSSSAGPPPSGSSKHTRRQVPVLESLDE